MFFFLDIMTEFYQVYVGNLLMSVQKKELEDLFSEVGDVGFIWINPKYKAITYAFIGFGNLDTAKEACKRFDNYELNFCKIKVKMSFKNVCVNVVNKKSILLELPKKRGVSKSHLLKKLLTKDLKQNREIVEDFKMACQEMENVVDSNKCEMIKTNAEQCDLKTLEETIIRNFKKAGQKKTIDIDFDLTKGKVLSTEQSNKWFNLQFPTTTTTKATTTKANTTTKKKIPFELDYRSVCD